MNPTPAPSPAPAPTLSKTAQFIESLNGRKLNMVEILEHITAFALSLERALAQRDAEVAEAQADAANTKEDLRKWQLIEGNLQESCKRLTAQLRAAEERAVRAEESLRRAHEYEAERHRFFLAALDAVGMKGEVGGLASLERQVVEKINQLSARLSSVAEDIEKTGAVEALKREIQSTGPNGRVIPWNVSKGRMEFALASLTALQSKLRSDGAQGVETNLIRILRRVQQATIKRNETLDEWEDAQMYYIVGQQKYDNAKADHDAAWTEYTEAWNEAAQALASAPQATAGEAVSTIDNTQNHAPCISCGRVFANDPQPVCPFCGRNRYHKTPLLSAHPAKTKETSA